jgi:hypothetical protein
MKRSRFSEEQIIAVSKEQEAGMATADVCRLVPSGRRWLIPFPLPLWLTQRRASSASALGAASGG